MAVGTVGASGALGNQKFRAALTDVFAGAICSILSIAYCLSYAALIFTGPLEHLLAYGVAVTFLSAAVGGAIVALRSSLPFAVAGPDSSISVVMAAMVATVVQRLVAGGTDLLEPALDRHVVGDGADRAAALHARLYPCRTRDPFCALSGDRRLSRRHRLADDHGRDAGGHRPAADARQSRRLRRHRDRQPSSPPALVVGVALHLLLRRSKSPFVLPGVLLAAFAATYLVLLLSGASIGRARKADGWMFRPQPGGRARARRGNSGTLQSFSWTSLPALAGDLLAVMFVTVSTLLLNTTGIEIATRSEANIERDLKVLGVANIVTAALGGYVSCTSLSRSILVRTAGATSRLAGLTVAAISAVVLIADPSFLGYVPKYILGGLLFFLGAGLVYQWLIQSSRQLPRIEYLSLIAIALLIINWGFIAGVLIGIVIGCATFALSASRVNAIKFSFDGSEYRSSLDRGAAGAGASGQARPRDPGHGAAKLSVLRLGQPALPARQGAARAAAGMPLPDFRFSPRDRHRIRRQRKALRKSSRRRAKPALASCSSISRRNWSGAFRTAGFISDDVIVASDLDRALESCEQAIIEAHRAEGERPAVVARLAVRSAGRCPSSPIGWPNIAGASKFEAGDIIARQGEPAASMHFILEGRVGIIVDMPDGRTMRVRSLGRHTTVGEMGLITRRPRSATIQAEAASVLYELDADAFERIKREQPALSQALLAYVIAVMTERLSFANRADRRLAALKLTETSAALPAAAALLAEAHLLGELRSGRRIVRRHHRIIRRQTPFLAILLRASCRTACADGA